MTREGIKKWRWVVKGSEVSPYRELAGSAHTLSKQNQHCAFWEVSVSRPIHDVCFNSNPNYLNFCVGSREYMDVRSKGADVVHMSKITLAVNRSLSQYLCIF